MNNNDNPHLFRIKFEAETEGLDLFSCCRSEIQTDDKRTCQNQPRKSREACVEIILILQYDLQIGSWWLSRVIRPSHQNYVS